MMKNNEYETLCKISGHEHWRYSEFVRELEEITDPVQIDILEALIDEAQRRMDKADSDLDHYVKRMEEY